MDADVIVVGGGHNGLVCAAYLARAGLDTLLLEARAAVGGCASTVSDLDARFNVCNCDHTMIRAMPVADELDLDAHGLRYLESEIGSIQRFHDGSPPWITLHDVDAHLDALATSHPGQVAGYRRYLDDALPVARLVIELARTTPSTAAMLATVARRRGAGAARLLQWSRMSMTDVLAEYFDDWHLVMPAVSAGPTVWGVPPSTPGTGLAAAIYATRHVVRTGRPQGGSGALTDAVRASFEAAGGRVRCDSTVVRLTSPAAGSWRVRLSDGSELEAARVVAACDPRRVVGEWLDDRTGAAEGMVERYRSAPSPEGYESKVDAVLAGLPGWRDDDRVRELAPGADTLSPTTIVSPSPTELAEAHELRGAGLVAGHPTMLVNVPSLLDPDMQPHPGQHVLSLEVLFTPYSLHGGWPGTGEPQRWIDLVDGMMKPGSLRLDRWRAMTPDRYEAEFHLHRGHTPAYSGSPLRALAGLDHEVTRYRAPADGLYLTGAGTFPGAGIFGAPGRNAADAVTRDLRHGDLVGGLRRRVATLLGSS